MKNKIIFKEQINPQWVLINNSDGNIPEFMKQGIFHTQWLYEDEDIRLSIIYSIFGKYETYDGIEIERFDTLEEAKNYLINNLKLKG